MTTGETKALTRWTFVGQVMSLLFNMLFRLVIAFLPRSKHLLISWLQSLSAVILEFPKIKSVTVSTVSPSICHEVMGPDAMILIFRIYLTMPETWVQSPGWVDPLEKEISTYSNMFVWEISWTKEPGRLVHGVPKEEDMT